MAEFIAVTTKKYYREDAALMGDHCPQAQVHSGVYPQTSLHVKSYKWNLITMFLKSASLCEYYRWEVFHSLYRSVTSVPDLDLQELSKE